MRVRQPEFCSHAPLQRSGKGRLVALQCGQCRVLIADQRQQRLAQAEQVPVGDVRLAIEGVAALAVGVVANMARDEGVEKLERSVIDGQAQDAHVVGVHHAVAKAGCLPLSQQLGGASADGLEQGRIGIGAKACTAAALRIVAVDAVVGELPERPGRSAIGEMLEMAETQKARRDARDDGGGLHLLAANACVRAGHTQRPGRRNAQSVHGLGAQKLADRTAQYGAAVAHARVGRRACALEL